MLSAVLLLAAVGSSSVPDTALYQQVLSKFVRGDGKVDYQGLRADPKALNDFVQQIAAVSPGSHPALFPSRNAKLAYWINAYNATVLQAFSAAYPEKRTRLSTEAGRQAFFFQEEHVFGGTRRTLDDVEVKDIRKAFGDPRIHMAIVCASTGCPWLSNVAYTAENVQAKLEEDARRYFAQNRNFAMDVSERTVTLPAIFNWFKEDFGKDPAKVLSFVAKYRPKEARLLQSEEWTIRYLEYDWSPNDLK